MVVDVSTRLGYALGATRVDCALTANSIVFTTLFNQFCITTARRNVDRGVNMTVVSEVQHIMLACEAGQMDRHAVREALANLQPRPYPPATGQCADSPSPPACAGCGCGNGWPGCTSTWRWSLW